uniref:Uncharacterized protein n=1 Tax=Anguilla anguilla TaxID=7936 RepID=A0A0E9Y2R0_ANGAN
MVCYSMNVHVLTEFFSTIFFKPQVAYCFWPALYALPFLKKQLFLCGVPPIFSCAKLS